MPKKHIKAMPTPRSPVTFKPKPVQRKLNNPLLIIDKFAKRKGCYLLCKCRSITDFRSFCESGVGKESTQRLRGL